MLTRLMVVAALVGMVAVSGCQSTTGKPTGQTMTDTRITAAVQAKLTADRISNFARVDVDTDRGVVQLSGIVQSPDQKSRAEELTRQVEGVTQVRNNLQIQRQSSQRD